MTLDAQVRHVRRALELTAIAESALLALLAFFSIEIAAAALNAISPVAPGIWSYERILSLAGGIVMFASQLWRRRLVTSLPRVALWLEEQNPKLRYAVVTALEPAYSNLGPDVEPLLRDVDAIGSTRRLGVHRLVTPTVSLIIIALLYFLLPVSWKTARAGAGSATRGAAFPAGVLGNRLQDVSATVRPPAYTGFSERRLAHPSTITALQGSSVSLEGAGPHDGVTARVVSASGAERMLPVTGNADNSVWTASLVIADSTGELIRLADRRYSKLIVINPIVDEPPDVRLQLPARDTTLRSIPAALPLEAYLTDDIQLAAAQFEYIISSGSEETFTFVHGSVGARNINGRESRLTAALPLSRLKLGEGDRISIRAIASDGNTVTGPGRGYSETRTIRIARKKEYDTVYVTPAMPSSDTAMMSLRMLILETERLDAQKASTPRPAFVAQSRKLAAQSEQIRQRIQRIVDEQTANGQVEVQPPLLTAVNAMWDATRELDIGGTAEALPPLRVAYAALQSMRDEKRYYLRGGTRPIIVNIQRVRLSGSERGISPERVARPIAASDMEAMRRSYSTAVRLISTQPDSAVALLAMLRVQSLRGNPTLSAALGDAMDAIEAGRDVTLPLLRARRVLEGPSVRLDSLPSWGGGW